MRSMIESLESRTLLSGTTTATLAADNSTIISDASVVKGAMNALFTTEIANDQTIVSALAGVHTPGTSGVIRSLKADQARARTMLKQDLNGLINPALALTKKSVAAGNALLKKSSRPKIDRVALDAAALTKVVTKPLEKIEALLGSTKIIDDLEALRTLNSGNTTVSAAITVAESGQDTQAAAVVAAAMTFQTDLHTFSSHLVSIFAG